MFSATSIKRQSRSGADRCKDVVLTCVLTALVTWCCVGSAGAVARIGARSDVVATDFDFHAGSGNYFSALRYDTLSDDCFSVNLSVDQGATWVETFGWCTGQELGDDIGAAVVGDFFYVAYTMVTPVHNAKLMRFRWHDGEKDPVFGSQIVFSAMIGDDISDIAVCTNADSFDNRLYLFAVNSDHLRFFWTDENGGAGGEPWHEEATGVSNAWWMFDVTSNENYGAGSGYHPMVVYGNDDFDLVVWRFRGDGPAVTVLDPATYGSGSGISAYDDHVAVTFWNQSYEFKTCVSDDGGGTFICEVFPVIGDQFFGDVNARQGAGIAEMTIYENDSTCWYRYRDYVGSWSDQVRCSELDITGSAPMRLVSLPPHTPFSYGAVVLSNDPVADAAYFIRSPVVFADGFETGDLSAW